MYNRGMLNKSKELNNMEIKKSILDKVESMSNQEVADYLKMKNPKKVCWELARQRVAEGLQNKEELDRKFDDVFRRIILKTFGS
jgi:pheromone shutdown protein TraB